MRGLILIALIIALSVQKSSDNLTLVMNMYTGTIITIRLNIQELTVAQAMFL